MTKPPDFGVLNFVGDFVLPWPLPLGLQTAEKNLANATTEVESAIESCAWLVVRVLSLRGWQYDTGKNEGLWRRQEVIYLPVSSP